MSSAPGLKLEYDFTTRPDPFYASISIENPNTVDVTVMITNPTAWDITLTKLTIEIPVGHDTARDLSADQALPDPVLLTGTDQWEASKSGSLVTLTPSADGSGQIGSDALLFELKDINVNGQKGTVPIIVTEYYPSGPSETDGSSYSLTKLPAEPATNFRADPAALEDPHQPVTLYWDCSEEGQNCVYRLRTSDGSWEPKPCTEGGDCYTWKDGAKGVQTFDLDSSKTFCLDVMQRDQKGNLYLYTTLTTAVPVTRPGVLAFQATQPNPIYADSFTLEWTLANATRLEIEATYADGSVEIITDDFMRRNIMVTPKTPNTKYTLTAQNDITTDEATAEVTVQLIPPMPLGSIIAYSGTQDPPSGDDNTGAVQWMLCDGRALSATDYSDLYDLIGASFGDGTLNNPNVSGNAFNIPDLRGMFIRGTDDMGGTATGRDPDMGSRGPMMKGAKNTGATSNKVGSVQGDAFQGHAHSFSITTSWVYSRGDGIVCGTNSDEMDKGGTPYAYPPHVGDATNGSYGGVRVTSETRPLNVYLNYIIRVK